MYTINTIKQDKKNAYQVKYFILSIRDFAIEPKATNNRLNSHEIKYELNQK